MAKASLFVSAMLVFIPRTHSTLAMRVKIQLSAFLSSPACAQRNQEALDPSLFSFAGCRAFATSSSSAASAKRRRTAARSPPSSSSTSLALQSSSVTRSRRPTFTSPVVKSPSSTTPAATTEQRRQPRLYGRKGKNGGSRRSEEEAEYRADRVLSNRTGKSRSECSELLQQRRVSYLDQHQTPTSGHDEREDGSKPSQWRRVPGPKHKLSMYTPLRIDATEVPMPPPLLFVYHKPKWVLSVRSDPRENRPCLDPRTLVRAGVPEAMALSTSSSTSLHAVGRLDYDSSGLLLLSSDGTLTQRILHPKHEIPKEYRAVVTGRVNATELSQRLTDGVETAEGVHTADLVDCRVWEGDAVPPYLEAVKRGLPSYYNQTDLATKGCFDVLRASELSTVTLVVREGKHRMVRRMLANCGHPVVDLTRNRIGSIELGDVKVGSVRDLTKDELAWARSLLKDR